MLIGNGKFPSITYSKYVLDEDSQGNSNIATYIGIGIGALVIAAISVVVVLFLCYKR